MNRDTFFAALRARGDRLLGRSLDQRQVEGIEALLDAGADLPAAHMANVLAQVTRETGGGMYPVKETVYRYSTDKNPSDATVIVRLDQAFAKGQLSWVKTPYWRGGYFGRGQIQATHEDNYRKLSPVVGVDLVKDPSRALELPISARIAVEGMRRGMFTGKKLADYDGALYRHEEARAIVNGDGNKRDKGATLTVGQTIARHAEMYESALLEAGWGAEPEPQYSGLSAIIAALVAALFRRTK